MLKNNHGIKDKIEHLLLFGSNKLLSWLYVVSKGAKVLGLLLSIVVLQVFIYEIGFDCEPSTKNMILDFYRLAVEYFTIIFTVTVLSSVLSSGREKIKLPNLILYVLLLSTFIPIIDKTVYHDGEPLLREILASDLYRRIVLVLLSVLYVSSSLIGLLGRKTSPPLIIMSSFAFIIMVGAGLLLLPNSTHDSISVVDAFFVSTSSVCVTGLTPFEISEIFTPMGQYVILVLIQIGGLGFMTLTSFFALFFIGNTSLYNQIIVSDIISSGSVNSIYSTLVRILGVTLLIEVVGLFLIWLNIHGTMGMAPIEEFEFALFHAISAFCNAGFSTLPGNLSNNLVSGNTSFITTIAFLIIFGGIGFPIITNFTKTTYNKVMNFIYKMIHRRRVSRNMLVYSINTKLVLTTTLCLIVGGTLLIAIFEWNGALAGMSAYEKIVQSFFAAVSPRTAGFNTIDLTTFSIQTYILTLMLMWIGGGSQSTAGGIKVNAFAVSFASAVAFARGKGRVDVMCRQLSHDTITRAYTTIFISVVIIFISIMVLSIIEPDISLQELFYEVISAVSTVGLSLGTTPLLSENGKIVIIILMYIGRIGIITLLLGSIRQSKNTKFNHPMDDIIIT